MVFKTIADKPYSNIPSGGPPVRRIARFGRGSIRSCQKPGLAFSMSRPDLRSAEAYGRRDSGKAGRASPGLVIPGGEKRICPDSMSSPEGGYEGADRFK